VTSERIQRRIDQLLTEADEAVSVSDWLRVQDRARNVLAFDSENSEALAYLAAAETALGSGGGHAVVGSGESAATAPAAPEPSSFANGRYTVKRFLGEGGKKKVYLAHDASLDRDVAFALIKTEGLDPSTSSGQAAIERIKREAQAMGRLGTHPNIVPIFDIGEEPVAGPFDRAQDAVGGQG